MRGLLRYAGAAPWRRAPWLLLRRPSVALALAGTAAILAVTAAATPLFIASAGSAALAQQLDSGCPYAAGASVRALVPQGDNLGAAGTITLARRIASVQAKAHDLRHHEPLLVSQYARIEALRADGTRLTQTLLARDGFAAHIQVLQRWGPAGAWVTEDAVRDLGLRRGTPVTLLADEYDGEGRPHTAQVELPIAGVYRDLARSLVTPFWCSLQQVIYPPTLSSDSPTPSVILVDNATYSKATEPLGRIGTTHLLELPLARAELTTAAAHEAEQDIQRFRARVDTDHEQFESYPTRLITANTLPHLLARADLVRDSLRTTVGPVAVAGVIVALLLVAAAGSFWAERRREEVALLVARGVGPAALTAKALLEMSPALVAGAAAGWLAAIGLVRTLGPSSLLGPGAVSGAAVAVAVALLLGLLLLGVVAAARFRAESERRRGERRSVLVLVPWELGGLAVAGVLLVRLVQSGTTASSAGGEVGSVTRLDPVLIAFPLVLLAGGVALALRALGWWLPRLARVGDSWPPARYLAARRIAGARGIALLLAAAAALPAGVLIYSASMTASVAGTVDAKVHVFTGSDVVAQLVSPVLPEALKGRATTVDRIDEVPLAGIAVDVLGVDAATFADGAYWNSRLSGTSLSALLERLRPREGEPVPVIASWHWNTDTTTELVLPGPESTQVTVPVSIRGTARHLPGESHLRPVVLMDRAALARATDAVFHQLWIRGEPETASRDLAASAAPVVFVQRADDVLDASSYLPVSYAFDLLRALALLTGAIGAGGLLLYLETRTRSRRVAYALARRMGLSRRAHLRSLVVELGGLLCLGLVVGGALAIGATAAAYRRLDLDPYVPPGPLLAVPGGPIALVVLGTMLLAGLAALAAQRSADRLSAAEVLRDAT